VGRLTVPVKCSIVGTDPVSLETTAIYMDLVGEEERAEVVGAW